MSSCLRTETPSVGSTPTRWVTIGSPGDGICPGTVGTGGPPVNRTDMLAVTLTSRSAQHRDQLQNGPTITTHVRSGSHRTCILLPFCQLHPVVLRRPQAHSSPLSDAASEDRSSATTTPRGCRGGGHSPAQNTLPSGSHA